MRMVLIGQAAFGAKVLETLLANGDEIAAVYTLPDPPKGRPDPVKEAALGRGIPVIQPKTYKDDQVYGQYTKWAPDLAVMAFVTPIIPARFLAVPAHGTINYHPSLLPNHRGASAINWALIMGDGRTGLSVFWPDGGIDTGPILLQKEVAIGEEDTTGSIYFNHLFTMGVEAMAEAVALIKAGHAPRIEQDETKATHEPICDDKVAAIDWARPGREVFNLIRGCDPQPGAFTAFKGEKIRLFGPRFQQAAGTETPGTVIACDDAGIRIALVGGLVTVAKVRGSGGKVSAAEFARQAGLKVGDRLG